MHAMMLPKSRVWRYFRLACVWTGVALFAAGEAAWMRAEVPASQKTSSPAHRTHHKRAHKKPPSTEAKPVPAAPPAPELPKWPINEPPVPARVTWDSRGLSIQASNSSLQQILHDVTTDTGIQVAGLGADQRMFGSYGPGPAKEVLAQLLHGTGYNVIMVGDESAGAPLKILLSGQPSGPAPSQPAPSFQSSDNSDDSADTDYQPPSPQPPMMNRFPPSVMSPRTPPEMPSPRGQQPQ